MKSNGIVLPNENNPRRYIDRRHFPSSLAHNVSNITVAPTVRGEMWKAIKRMVEVRG